MKKTIANFFYQSIFQITSIILPIITVPIVSNALGPKGIGIYNYTFSITSYFVLLAGLGLANYGIREIAIVKDDKDKLSQKFWELQLFNAVIAIFTIFLFLIIIQFLSYKNIYYSQILLIFGSLLDISWFYIGTEDFKKISIANVCIKILGFVFIFLFVKSYDDLQLYVLIQSSVVLLSQSFLWLFLRKKVYFRKVSLRTSFRHFRPSLEYFIGKVAISMYTSLNKTILGIIGTTVLVGLFSNSLQLITISATLVGTLDTVLLPQMAKLVEDKKFKLHIEILKSSLHFQLFLSIALFWGILSITPNLVDWFFGPDFERTKSMIPLLAPLVIIIPLGTAIFRQYMMPKNQIRRFNKIALISAAVSVVLNFLLIPFIGAYGAILATLISESFVTVTRIKDLYKETSFRFDYKKIVMLNFSGFIMFFILNILFRHNSSALILTIFQVISGGLVYFVLTLIMNVNPIFEYLKGKWINESKNL
ncbi:MULTISPECIES: oligosaccharide flippase family protein [Bacteria]|uniref:oligosaccharide flippase family protein n=1 Tax=Bacteria TaxID=2 RepID=UPI00115DE5A2|nr:oligosaccharide flippase family protein [Enterococcus casseliflavus]MBZ0322585.1 oligosaccharide flippase family protein [Enterococcus casseliflavus]WBY93190.1 oligosaccharide flippase family protein [Enterococcus casseliflavus]